MLIKKIGNLGGKSFRSKVINRIILSVAIIFIGIATGVLLLFFDLTKNTNSDFIDGFYIGLTSGLIAAGTISLIKNIILLKNEKKLKALEIMENDERNQFIINRTLQITALIGFITIYFAIILFGVINIVVFTTLLYVLGVCFIVALIVNLILKKVF